MIKLIDRVILLAALSLLLLAACESADSDASSLSVSDSSVQEAVSSEQSNVGEPSLSEPEESGESTLDKPEAPETAADPGGARDQWIYEFDTVTLDGARITEKDFYGNKLTVLNVWATWCPPCVGELPELQAVSEHYAGRDVEIVGVLQDGVTASGARDEAVVGTANTLIADAGVSYRMILPDSALTYMFIEDMQYFPTTYLLDSTGKVLKIVVGAGDEDDWRGTIDEVLGSIED